MDIKQGIRQQLPLCPGGRSPGSPVAGRLTAAGQHPSAKACRVAQDEVDAGLVSYQDKPKPRVDDLPNTFAR